MDKEIAALFSAGKASLVLKKGGILIYQTFGRGISPALELLDRQPELLRGAEVFDLIVGKAAASLFILGGAASVSALTMSESAVRLLEQYKVPCACQTLAPQIINRTGTGLCPFEQAVLALETPAACLPVIRQALHKLKNGGQ